MTTDPNFTILLKKIDKTEITGIKALEENTLTWSEYSI